MSTRHADPWPDLAAAQSFLLFLTGATKVTDFPFHTDAEFEALAYWLTERDLGPLAYARCRTVCLQLANYLQAELYLTAGQNSLHWRNLRNIDQRFARDQLAVVLLKGAALAETVYSGQEQRAMSDVDIWLQGKDIGPACRLMDDLEFYSYEKTNRPLALQALANGEIEFYSLDQPPTLVEMHFSPFPGWWFQRTANVDSSEVWSRKERIDGWQTFYQLAAEDAVIHVAVHLAVNHQFGLAAVRNLIDIALLDQVRDVNWDIVADRAQQWRLATAVWLVLSQVDQLIGVPRLKKALDRLQPSAWRRRQLKRFITPQSILADKDIRDGQERYLFLLLLVDRPRDAARLMARTLWPEDEWLDARYGGGVDHWQHIRRLIIQREV